MIGEACPRVMAIVMTSMAANAFELEQPRGSEFSVQFDFTGPPPADRPPQKGQGGIVEGTTWCRRLSNSKVGARGQIVTPT
jgi:hypothetical protein